MPYPRHINSHPLQTYFEYKKILSESNDGKLDLRKIKSVEWDEMVIWRPYANICDYGIDGYVKDGSNCVWSSDDGECYILLLRQNKLVAQLGILRRKVDLCTVDLGRVKREQAILTFDQNKDWAKPNLILEEKVNTDHQ